MRAVLRQHPVLREEPIADPVRPLVLLGHARTVVGVDLLDPELGGRSPLLLACSRADRLPADSCRSSWRARPGGRCRRSPGSLRRAPGRRRGRSGSTDRGSAVAAHKPADDPGEQRDPRHHARRDRSTPRARGRRRRSDPSPSMRGRACRRWWCSHPRRHRWTRPAARTRAPPRRRSRVRARRAPPSCFSIGRCQPFDDAPRSLTPPATDAAQIRSISASAASSDASSGDRRSTWSSHRSGTTFVRVPPRATPTFTVTPGHRPFKRLERDDLVGGLQERVAPLLRLDARVRGPPRDRDRVVGDALARADDVAVGSRAFEHEGRVVPRRSSRITGPLNGEPISSSGLQT